MRLLVLAFALTLPAAAQQSTTWRLDNLTQIGGHAITVVGSPKLIDTGVGKAIHFQGASSTGTTTGTSPTGDAIFLDINPLTGALPYTWEMVFRPSSTGAQAQRIFHLQESASDSRRLFELRIVDHQWCLDAFATTVLPNEKPHAAVVLPCDPAHLHPLDQWYAVAAIYDGNTLRSYVNGVLQGEAPVALTPLGKGGVSIGTRYNKRDFFTGDIFSARFTPRALPISGLLKVPQPTGASTIRP